MSGRCGSAAPPHGGSGSFIDAVLRDREEIERIHRRIGTGTAMAVPIRPSKRGSRVNITDQVVRMLVDRIATHLDGWDEVGLPGERS
ncbi:hypothetical protein [Tritonibacter mobilis]|uniref:hypothetical protein n=1 Tax=Tritonibacter mobilis TaxID=379347 RepID=UPI000806D3B3|nr:hypothetical protein [Tritonibacter mobilis]